MITAPENIDLNAKNISISADENILISAKSNITEIAGEVLSVQSKNKTEQVEEQMNIDVKKDVSLNIGGNSTTVVSDDADLTAGKIAVDATDADMFLSATGKITLKSGDIVDIA